MDPHIIKFLLALTYVLHIYATHVGGNGTIEEREPRVNRRVVKLYSGTRPKPIVCSSEGFQSDPNDCAAFHRCLKSGNGRYLSFRFQCSPGTIFDLDAGICNHPQNTKRSECGGQVLHADTSTIDNEINREIPSPISTREPVYPDRNSGIKGSSAIWSTQISNSQATKSPWIEMGDQNKETPKNYDFFQRITTKATTTKRQQSELPIPTPQKISSQLTNNSKYTTPRVVTFNNKESISQPGGVCNTDGLIGDAVNCRKFYRCVGNQRGGFIKYEFLCTEPTIWDEDKKACNHDWAVKRSRCGREQNLSEEIKDFSRLNQPFDKEKNKRNNLSPGSQTQLQISYGEKVTQTQTQISKGSIVQNQTQINYSDSYSNKSIHKEQVLQNQTQITHGSSVSQSQTQINYGNKGIQTQLQIDHSNDSSQSQMQASEYNGTKTTTSSFINNEQMGTNSNNICNRSGFMGDTDDCKKFYRCVDNGKGGYTRYEFSCSEGTVWDSSIESCNHAWAVKECGRKGSETSTQNSTEITQIASTQAVTHSTMENTQGQSIVTTNSTTTQNYNPTTELETDDNDISYGEPSLPETSSATTTTKKQQNFDSSTCTSSGFIGDNVDCKKFYRCVDNGKGGYTRYEFSCGEGTVWDSKIEACNHAWAVESCGANNNNDINKDETTTVAIITSQLPSTQISSQIPHNDDYDTGYGTQHDEERPSSLSTVIDHTTTKRTTTQIQSDSECISSGFIGDNSDCKKFYRCVDNGNGAFIKYEFTCGEGTVWDAKNQACNHAWAVEKCGGTITEDTGSTTIKDQNNALFTSTSTTTIGVPSENNEVGYVQENNDTLPTSTTHKPDSQFLDDNNCKSSGFMGDSNDCKKFYRCVDNGNGGFVRYEFACGEGTVWDSKIDACNHHWAVKSCNSNGTQGMQTSSQSTSIDDDGNNIGYPIQNDDILEKPENSSETTTSSSTSASLSSTGSECKESGFMGNPKDCKIFYRCVDDGHGGFTRYEFTCGEGTVWDQSLETCNYQGNVKNCGPLQNADHVQQTTQSTSTLNINTEADGNVQPSTQKTSTTTSFPESFNNICLQEGYFGDVNNCKQFYRCVNNGKGGYTKYEFTCGEGTIWNQEIQACDHESSDRKTCKINNSQSPTNKPNIDNDEILTETTTKGTTSSTNEEDGTSSKPSPTNRKCNNEGFFSDSTDCKKFYRCVDDGKKGYTKYEFTCGDGTFWDQEALTCNHEYKNEKCKTISNSTTTTTSQSNSDHTENTIQNFDQTTKKPATNTSTSEDQCSSEGFFANSYDCKKFYRCVSNSKEGFTKFDFTCSEGTIWVQEIQACDHDDGKLSCSNQVSSSNPQNTDSTTSSSTSALHQTSQSNFTDNENDEYINETSNKPSSSEICTSEGFYANKNDCTRFYRCVDNGQGSFTRYDFTCGEGTAWNADIQTCDHADKVKGCSNSNQQPESQTKPMVDDQMSSHTTEGTSATDNTSSQSSQENNDACNQEGYFGNSHDCTKFYRCVDNGNGGLTKYDFDCGEGTIWDQVLTTCNHPQDVVNPSCKQGQGASTAENTNTMTESSSTSASEANTSTQNPQSSTGESDQNTNCSQESTSRKPSQKVKCEEAGYYADPDNCKKFYRCVDWDGNGKRFSVYHFECGEGTIWDPELQTCNHEDSVYPPRDCSGTQNQNENMTQETTTSTEKTTTSQENASSETESTTLSTTTEQSTSSEATTKEQTSQQPTTSETTTTHKSTSSEQTTQQQTTTTQKLTSSEQTTQQTTSEKTTQQTETSSEQTTSQHTTEPSTTEETTTTSQQTTQETTHTDTTTTQQSTSSKQTTTQQSTSSEQTTQSSATEQTTTTQAATESQATTEQSTDAESTTTQSSTSTTDQGETSSEQTEQSTTESTTQQSTESDTTTTEASKTTTEDTSNSSTTENTQESTTEDNTSSDKECPETEEDQYLYVCPTSFRRHPKYCNMFYQCTEDDDSHEVKIATFTCPNNTIYDESKTQCVEEKKANKKCNGQKARRHRVKRLNLYSKEPIEASRNKYVCPGVGYYPFEKENECSDAFLKCTMKKSGQLRGYVYRCPEGFIYWSISKRCEKKDYMKHCKQSSNDWSQRWEILIETRNLAK